MLVVSLGGSPSQRSRSGVLLERSQRWLQGQGVEVVSYQVRDFPAEDLLHARFDSPKVVDLLQQIENADGLLIATPVYKASFSGALKTVLDLLPERADEKPALDFRGVAQEWPRVPDRPADDPPERGREPVEGKRHRVPPLSGRRTTKTPSSAPNTPSGTPIASPR